MNDDVSAWVRRFAPLIAPGGDVLDVACGRGRHVRFLLDRGFRVTAVDIDVSGLSDIAGTGGLSIIERDLEQAPWPFPSGSFDAIVIVNYLHRPLFDHLPASLRPGGLLIVDTFAAGNERFGRPRNPAWLLRPGELQERLAARLSVIAYEHGEVDEPAPAVRQRLCARKKDRNENR